MVMAAMAMVFPHPLRLFFAGILALPALLLLVVVSPLVILLSIPSLAILVRRKRNFLSSFGRSGNGNRSDAKNNNGHPLLQHAVITGGSSGIGLSIAIELAKRRCPHITLVARKEGQLADAKRLVEGASAASASRAAGSVVRAVSVDVADFEALEKAAAKLCGDANDDEADGVPGPPTLLFHCAGYSVPLAFEDLSVSSFRGLASVNYLGSVHVVKSFLPHMARGQHPVGGNIVLTSSMAGQIGTFGYCAYAPTKFALRGFAECLSMELAAKKSNVNVSLAYPPETNTPGYEIENQSKPEECRRISETAGVWEPEVVGKKMLDEALSTNPPFDIYFGIDGWMLATLTSGMNPVTSLGDAICQVASMGLLRFVSLFYLMDFGRITQSFHDAKETPDNTSKED